MAINYRKYISGIIAMLLLQFTSCSVETEPDGTVSSRPVELKVGMKLQGTSTGTRANVREDDGWTYVSFKKGDQIGFYSSNGSWPNNGPFVNLELVFDHTSKETNESIFQTGDGQTFDPAGMIAKNVFLYSPYTSAMEDNAELGLSLRQKPEDDPGAAWRCIDFLTGHGFNATHLEQGLLSGEFYHIFSELVIIRGEGFDNPKAPNGEDANRITVVMKQPFTHVRILKGNNPWSCIPDLVFDQNGDWTEDQAKRWDAWEAGMYYDNNINIPVQASYVVIPTLGNTDKETGIPASYGKQTEVDYIELYDNDGVLQRVTALSLAEGNTRKLNSGWRYPMTISMNELVPTVFPHTIQPWGEDRNITDIRKKGVTMANFKNFVDDYNSYTSSPGNFETNKFYEYGDYERVEGSEVGKWHFYLQSDINLEALYPNYGGGNPIIREFADILDGKKSTLQDSRGSNYRIFNQKCPLIGTLVSAGEVIDIDFDSPFINCTWDGPDNDYNYIGAIVNNITTGGAIVDCTITNGTVIAPNYVGLIAGSVMQGSLNTPKGCIVQGLVVGQNSDAQTGYMFGHYAGSEFSVLNEANIIFNRIGNSTP